MLSSSRLVGAVGWMSPNFLSPADRVTDSLLCLSDIVVPNSTEGRRLTGIECRDVQSPIQTGDRLLERGAGAACTKLADGETAIHVSIPCHVVLKVQSFIAVARRHDGRRQNQLSQISGTVGSFIVIPRVNVIDRLPDLQPS